MNHNKAIDYALYLVTDRTLLGGRDLQQSIEAAILGGVTIVQLREKELSTLEFFNFATQIKAVTDNYQIPLIINDRLDIALAVEAAGLHVGQDDLPAATARKLLGSDKILGVSAATVDEAIKAEADGADYLGIGAVFPTDTKKDACQVLLNTLGTIKKQVGIPVVAIGGINQSNLALVKEQEVDGIAVISAILCQENIKLAARFLYEGWLESRS
jgi:thiamine-phosphate pyrophosphorylase